MAADNLNFSLASSTGMRFFVVAISVSVIARAHGQEAQLFPNFTMKSEPEYAVPLPDAEIKGTWLVGGAREEKLAIRATAQLDAVQQQQDPAVATTSLSTFAPPKSTKHEVSVSGDFTFGEGTVTLPLGYSLRETLGSVAGVSPLVAEADRSSVYFGTTISYSYGQAWYVDFSFARGESSGQQNLEAGWLGNIPSEFQITDNWLQAYMRYTFPRLRGKRLSAYLRFGASVVLAELEADAVSPAAGRYNQIDETRDILGNAGFGLGYSIYSSRRSRLLTQLEGEGLFGFRDQKSLESLSADEGLNFKPATIDNTLYGGIGRVTLRYELRLGRSGLFKLYADGGAQVRYTVISYPDATAPDELLWGPYVKLGFRYAF